RDVAGENLAAGAVDRNVVAFFQDNGTGGEGFPLVIDHDVRRAADADFTHLAGDEGGVGADSAAGGEDAFGGEHSAEIFRRSFDAAKNDALALVGEAFGFVGAEDDLAGSGA